MPAEAEAIVTTAAADAAPAQPVSPSKDADAKSKADTTPALTDAAKAEQERAEKLLKAKELFSNGSRNFLVKSYDEAADELSQVCALYEELYGELSDELGQPLLLYAKSLIAIALDENKVIDVPDEANDAEEDVDDEEMEEEGECDDEQTAEEPANGAASTTVSNGSHLASIKECADEADSTGDADKPNSAAGSSSASSSSKRPPTGVDEVSSSGATEAAADAAASSNANGTDDDRPSTSNGEATTSSGNGVSTGEEEQNEDETDEGPNGSLQLAWELLGAAAKIFSRQGLSGLPYLADVQTEQANIEFENGILDSAREDYEKALKIHAELDKRNRRVLAELHYKIGLTYLMQQQNKEGASALRNSCTLIEEEIAEIQGKDTLSDREKNNVLDLEETKQEIVAKIQEIEEMQAQTMAEVRAALDSYIRPMSSGSGGGDAAASSSTSSNGGTATSSSSSSTAAKGAASSSTISSSSKPTDITHLIKRKKPEEPDSEAEAVSSPAKRAAV